MFNLMFDRLLMLETHFLLKRGLFYIALFYLLLVWLCNDDAIKHCVFLKTPNPSEIREDIIKPDLYAADAAFTPLPLDFFKSGFKPCAQPLAIFEQDSTLAQKPLYVLRAQRLSNEEQEEKLQSQTRWQMDLQGDYATLMRVFFDFAARCPIANPESLVIEAAQDPNKSKGGANVVMHLKIAIPSVQAFLQKPQSPVMDSIDISMLRPNQEKLSNPFVSSKTLTPPAGIIKSELKTYEFA